METICDSSKVLVQVDLLLLDGARSVLVQSLRFDLRQVGPDTSRYAGLLHTFELLLHHLLILDFWKLSSTLHCKQI